MNPISLFELNHLVQSLLRSELQPTFWITAELSEVRLASNGHCYLEFIEKEEKRNHLVAKARGNIWRNVYPLLSTYFEKTTGKTLAPGMKVLVEVEVTFHEVYGYSLNVVDIDPTYTLGEAVRRRQEIIAQLQKEGVFSLNKELTLPRPIRRIAIISSSTAAGYGDFTQQLSQSNYPFEIRLFPCMMQGEQVENSMIAALNAIAEEQDRWDVVVIIRGGGAVSDLNDFDSYLLANNVAQFPLPILTGIGHERDETVLDYVAHTRLKTPTAVAAFLVEARLKEVQWLNELKRALEKNTTKIIEKEKHIHQIWSLQLQTSARHYCGRERERLSHEMSRFILNIEQNIHKQQYLLEGIPQRINTALQHYFEYSHQRLCMMEQTLKMAGPERILKWGYSITYCNGKVVTSENELKKGDRLTTLLAKGKIDSIVQ